MLITNPGRENIHDFSILRVLEKSGHYHSRKSEKEACFLSPFRSEIQAPFDLFLDFKKPDFLFQFSLTLNLLSFSFYSLLKEVLRKQFKMCHCHDNLAFSPEGRKSKKEKR